MFFMKRWIYFIIHQQEQASTRMEKREDCTRKYLKSDIHTQTESGVDLQHVPKHIA